MPLGKSLRLRRILTQGRALITPLEHGFEDPAGLVRVLARSGVDAVTLSPGVLELVADELGGLAVILRMNGGRARRLQFISMQGALEMGVEAVLLSVDSEDSSDLEKLGRVTEDARRLCMPVIADIVSEDLLTAVNVAAEYGADLVQIQYSGNQSDLRRAVRTAGRPVLAAPGRRPVIADLLRVINECLESAVQGIVFDPKPEAMLPAIHGLVHQGVTVDEALALAAAG